MIEEAKLKGHITLDGAFKDSIAKLQRANQRAIFILTFDGNIHIKTAYRDSNGAAFCDRLEKSARQILGLNHDPEAENHGQESLVPSTQIDG